MWFPGVSVYLRFQAFFAADPYRDPYGNGEGKGSESSGEKGTYLFYASKFYISVLR